VSRPTIQISACALTLLIVSTAACWLRQSPAQQCVDNVYFPKEMFILQQDRIARIQAYYSGMTETPFSCLDEGTEAYRFLFIPSFDRAASILISRQANQKVMVVKQLSSEGVPQNGATALKVNVTRPLTDGEWDHFQELLAKTSFWSMKPEDDRAGLDGATLLVEGRRPNEYHAVVRWSPEDQDFLNACDYFLELGRLEWNH